MFKPFPMACYQQVTQCILFCLEVKLQDKPWMWNCWVKENERETSLAAAMQMTEEVGEFIQI